MGVWQVDGAPFFPGMLEVYSKAEGGGMPACEAVMAMNDGIIILQSTLKFSDVPAKVCRPRPPYERLDRTRPSPLDYACM